MFQEIVDQSEIAVVVSDFDTRTIIYANDSVKRILEIPMEVELIGQSTAALYTGGESLISREELSDFKPDRFWERDLYTAKGKYLKLKGRETKWNDRRAYTIYIFDETKEQELIHNVPGGLTIMELNVSGSCKVTFANNSWLEMMDTTWQVFERVYARDYFGWIYPKDRNMVKNQIITNWGKSKIYVEPFRVKTTIGKILHLSANLTRRSIDGSNAQYYCVFTDISAQIETHKDLEEAQKRLDIIQSNSNLLIWEVDFERNVLIPDRHSARVFHSTKKEYPYPDIIRDVDAFDSATKTSLLNYMRVFQKGEEAGQIEVLVHTSVNENIWVLVRSAAMDVEDGLVTKGILWCRDITDQKRMENIYISRISRSLNISDKTEVAFVFDLTNNRIIESSSNNYEMFSRLHQMKVDDYLKEICQNAEDSYELESKLNVEVMLESFRTGTRRGTVKYYNQVKRRYFECSYELLENPYNKHLEAFVSFQDVSEVVKMEKIVQSLINMNYEAIYTVDLNTMTPTLYQTTEGGDIQRQKEERRSYKDYMMEFLESIGTPDNYNRILEENAIASVTAELMNHATHTTFFSVRVRGNEQEIRQMKAVYRYMDDKRDTLIVVLIDITAEYEQEKQEKLELEMALKAANAANEAKTDFLSRMSHDIRTPMNAILGLADLASKEETSPKVREYIDKINTSGEFLLQLVNDILDMAKIENGNLEFHPEAFTTEEFEDGIQTIIGPLIKEKQMKFKMTLTGHKGCYLVDRLRFNQIFFNLLSNAVKYTPKGGEIYLYTERIPSKEEHKIGFRYHIKDNGIGMSEEFQRKIFEPFEQEFNDVLNNTQGTGLGTTIVKRIVDAMGGDIQVRSEQGKGTEFIIDLFLEPADLKQNQEVGQSIEEIQLFLKGKKVLLVEDNEMNILVAKTQLVKIGMDVTVAQNGQEAVEHYTKDVPDCYDVILMDRRMPVMDGIEATKRIRKINKKVPIIAMTADAFDDDTRISLEAGMNAHLTKPVVPMELYRTLATTIASV